MITDFEEIKAQRFQINFDNGLLSMSKSLKDLEDYVKNIKWQYQKEQIEKFELDKVSYNQKDIENKLGRKHKIVGSNLIQFIDLIQWRFDRYLINPISTHNEELGRAFNGKMGVSRIINKACDIKLLYCVEHSFDKDTGDAKLYFLNDNMVSALKNIYGKDYSKSSRVSNAKVQNKPVVELTDDQKSRIKIDSKIGMNITGITDEQIIEVLNEKYPMYVEGKAIAEELNKDLPDVEKIKWQWTIERRRNKNNQEFLSKIGFRASNTICTYKAHINENPNYKGKWRGVYLDEVFGEKKWENYDVNGSIWRLTYNLNHDEMLSLDTDVYTELWKAINFGEDFKEGEREQFKYIAMRLYFGKNAGRDYLYTFNQYLKGINEDEIGGDDLRYTINETFGESRILVEEWLNGMYGNEIFLHESFIYLKMFKKIKELINDRLIQVYDSFYLSNKWFNKDKLNNIYINCINEYKIKYKNYIDIHIGNIFEKSEKEDKKIKVSRDKVVEKKKSRLQIMRDTVKNCLDEAVTKCFISFECANRFAREVGVDYKWSVKNQRNGFTVTNETMKFYSQLKKEIEIIKKRIEEQIQLDNKLFINE